MWNDLVTLYIDDTSLRLLVCQGQTIKKCANMKLESGLIKSSVVLKETEVVDRIKQLLEGQEVNAKKVVLGLSGLHSLTRPATLPLLPRSMIAEAVVREARRILPVPLDQLHLIWKTIPGSKGKIQVYMAATPRKAVDSLIKVLNGAGLQPSRMVLKPLVLTKLLPVNTAILVDLQQTEFDILIMVDGISQPVRTINLPNEELTPEQKLDMIAGDLDRTIKFYDTNNPETPLAPKIPIYVSGELIGKTDLQQMLSEKIGHPVLTLSQPMKETNQIDLEIYSVNLAMAAKTAIPGREANFPLADLDLLPIPYRPKPMSLAKIIGIPAAAVFAGLSVTMLLMIQNASASLIATQTQIDNVNKLITEQTLQKNELKKQMTEMQNQSSALQDTSDRYESVINLLETRREYLKGDLIVMLGRLDPAITLSEATLSDDTLTISGWSPNKEDIYTYAQSILGYCRQLDSSQRFIESTVSSLSIVDPVENAEEGKIQFVLTFNRGGN